MRCPAVTETSAPGIAPDCCLQGSLSLLILVIYIYEARTDFYAVARGLT